MTQATTKPTITGPVTGGKHGWPFGSPSIPPSQYRYTEEEYFIEGTATCYRPVPGTTFGKDGRWQAEATGEAPYKTRFVVYRPEDPARFNGTVYVGWNNVTSGYDILATVEAPQVHRDGAAIVQVTTQPVGIEGFPSNPRGLKAWDAERYGSLSIVNNDFAFDIFSQVARAVGPERESSGVDAIGGLGVERLVAQGGSQSAAFLATYANAIHPVHEVFDGFLLTLSFGSGAKLDNGDRVYDPMAMTKEERDSFSYPPGTVTIRDDLRVPVFVMNSETESQYVYPGRRRDTERFRFWEVAGTAHVSKQATLARMVKMDRDGVQSIIPTDGTNELPIGPVYNAAYRHMHAWLATGTPPPEQPRIEIAGTPPAIVRDQHGNAKGGIRLPQVDVPLARHSSESWSESNTDLLRGSTEWFSPEKAKELYRDKATYITRFEAAAQDAVGRGVLLQEDVAALVEEATADWPENMEPK